MDKPVRKSVERLLKIDAENATEQDKILADLATDAADRNKAKEAAREAVVAWATDELVRFRPKPDVTKTQRSRAGTVDVIATLSFSRRSKARQKVSFSFAVSVGSRDEKGFVLLLEDGDKAEPKRWPASQFSREVADAAIDELIASLPE